MKRENLENDLDLLTEMLKGNMTYQNTCQFTTQKGKELAEQIFENEDDDCEDCDDLRDIYEEIKEEIEGLEGNIRDLQEHIGDIKTILKKVQ